MARKRKFDPKRCEGALQERWDSFSDEEKLASLYGEMSAESLVGIRNTLNADYEPWVPALRRLLDLWWKSGPNLYAMFSDHPEIERTIDSEIRPAYIPSRWGRAFLALGWDDCGSTAHQVFVAITISSNWWRLGLCPKCGKYFVRKTQKKSFYCSPRCAAVATAARRTIEMRRQRAQRKLEAARKAIVQYEKLLAKGRTKQDWKEFVAGYDPAMEITPKYLTRAVNAGNLQLPKGEK